MSDSPQPVADMTVEAIRFEPSGPIPNHPRLPVLIYRAAVPEDGDRADAFEQAFTQNGWHGLWHDGIFDYQHYHSQAHEVLGIVSGKAQIKIGGDGGMAFNVIAGDCLILPAGTGHQRMEASRDFLVVGAYPPGQTADILTGMPTDAQRQRIADLPMPHTDPLQGELGPLGRYWARD